jgi:hypothetical protein
VTLTKKAFFFCDPPLKPFQEKLLFITVTISALPTGGGRRNVLENGGASVRVAEEGAAAPAAHHPENIPARAVAAPAGVIEFELLRVSKEEPMQRNQVKAIAEPADEQTAPPAQPIVNNLIIFTLEIANFKVQSQVVGKLRDLE